MGKDWEKNAADLPKKIENFRRQASPDSDVALWLQQAAGVLKDTSASFVAPIFYSASRAGKKVLTVNFDPRAAACVREGLLLQALGYTPQLQAHTVDIDGSSVVASISFLIAELAPLLPIADSLSESFKRYSDASQSADAFPRILLADARADVLKVLKEGSAICWSIDPRSIRDEIQPFAGKLCACVKKYIQLSEHAHAYCTQFQAAVSALNPASSSSPSASASPSSSSSSSSLSVATIVSSLDQIIQDVELGGFANTQFWIQEADAALETALASRLSALLRAWTTFLLAQRDGSEQLTAESSGISPEFFPAIFTALKDAPIHQLNMTLKNSAEALVCSPAVSESTRCLVLALNNIIMSFASIQRLMARTIKKSVAKKSATYSTLLSLLPEQDMRAAYAAIMTVSSRAQGFVNHWHSLQALWTSNPTEAAAMIGTDLDKWRSVLSDIRRDRAHTNSSETIKFIGPLRFDFSAAQNKVVQRYDLWSRSLVDLYCEQLTSSKAALLSAITAARDMFESLSTARGTEVSLKLLVALNEHEGSLAGWERDISLMALGEGLVMQQDDGRARMQVPSVSLEHMRGALFAFEQIFDKRKSAVNAAKSVLQQHVLDDERDAMRRYEQLLKDWDATKPDHKSCDAVNSLEILVGFKERCDALVAQVSKTSVARRSLGLDAAAGALPALTDQLSAEVTQMQLVWDSLSGPFRSLSDVDTIQLAAASVSAVRAQLEAIRSQAKALPPLVLQYAAYRGLIDRIDFRTRTLHVIADLKSPAMLPRHWQSLARACNVSVTLDGISLGFLWSSQLLQNEAAVREALSVAQGEFALQEFLDAIKTHWSSFKFEMFSVGRRALNIKGWDGIFATLSEHVTNMGSMKSSPYFKAFQEQASVWEDRLFRISQFADAAVDTQRRWIYLEGIFCGSGDIQAQLPLETNRFKSCDAEFVSAMQKISRCASVFDAVQDADIKRSIDRTQESLAKIQKSLSEYLESKRSDFPSFYFVGDEDLLELLGNSNDIIRLQKYMRKMFAGVAFLKLNSASAVAATLSPEGECMQFESALAAPAGRSVSLWLDELKTAITLTLRAKEFSVSHTSVLSIYRDDLSSSDSTERVAQWMDGSVCQALITSMQVAWTSSLTHSIASSSPMSIQSNLDHINRIIAIISSMSIRPVLDTIARKKCEHCILELVHQVNRSQTHAPRLDSLPLQRDITREISSSSAAAPCTTQSFSWLKHARFYVESGSDLVVSIADGRFS